jgi:hypothetical protein
MPELFSSFVYTAVFFGVVLGLGIVFEEKFIALEDKFDEWFEEVKKNVCKQKKVKSSR